MNRLFKLAVKCNAKTLVAHYIKKGSGLNELDSTGMTLLMYAASRNYTEVCLMLLEAGADPLLENSSGHIAATIAEKKGAHGAASLILNYRKAKVLDDGPSEHELAPFARHTSENGGTQPVVTANPKVSFLSIDDHAGTGSVLLKGEEPGVSSICSTVFIQNETVDIHTLAPLPEYSACTSPASCYPSKEPCQHFHENVVASEASDDYFVTGAANSSSVTMMARTGTSSEQCSTETVAESEKSSSIQRIPVDIRNNQSHSVHNDGAGDWRPDETNFSTGFTDPACGTWDALPDPDIPETEANETKAYSSIQVIISRHIPEDDSEEWPSESENLHASERMEIDHEILKPIDDSVMAVFYTGVSNGRIFRTQLDGLNENNADDWEGNPALVEFVCGQADIIIDDAAPDATGTDEDYLMEVIQHGAEWDTTLAMADFMKHLTGNEHDPIEIMQSQMFQSKKLERHEGPALSRMLEEGYLEALEAIVSSPFVMSLLQEQVNMDTEDDDFGDGEYDDDDETSSRGETPSCPDSNKVIPKFGTVPSRTEISRIIDDYSMLATRFSNRIPKRQDNDNTSKTIVERLYSAGISAKHLSGLHLNFGNFMKRVSTSVEEITELLHSKAGVPHEEIRRLLSKLSLSDMHRTLIVEMGHVVPEILISVQENLTELARLLDISALSLNGLRSIWQKYEGGMKKISLSRTRLIEKNQRLVWYVARRYKKRDLPYADIIQQGFVGLLQATDRYRHQKGYAFSTYAIHWIKQAITRAIQNQSRLIRLPVHIEEKLATMFTMNQYWLRFGGKEPNRKDVMSKMNISERTLERLSGVPRTFVDFDDLESQELITSHMVYGNAEDDYISRIFYQETVKQVALVLDSLDPRSAMILKMRFGIGFDEPKTLETVGEELNVTRERIRQIEAKALKRLAHPSRSKQLRPFLG